MYIKSQDILPSTTNSSGTNCIKNTWSKGVQRKRKKGTTRIESAAKADSAFQWAGNKAESAFGSARFYLPFRHL